MKKKLTILVVDDKAENLADALKLLSAQRINVLLASCPRHAFDMMSAHEGRIDGVISDIFMPYKPPRDVDFGRILVHDYTDDEVVNQAAKTDIYSAMEYIIAKHKLGNEPADQPTGVSVARAAVSAELPVVFCTSGHHHGSKYQWIVDWAHNLGLAGFVDCVYQEEYSHYEQEGPKDWPEALKQLLQEIERRKKK